MIPFFFSNPSSFFVIQGRVNIYVYVRMRKCNVKQMCLRVLSSMFNMWIHIKERQKRKKDKKGFVLETKKKKSASMRVQIKAWPARGRQTTATEMAVAGMFQRSDARRYILIHGRLAPRLTGGKNEQI